MSMQEILGSYAQSQFWWDVHKILTQGVNMYPLSGNIIFFPIGFHDQKLSCLVFFGQLQATLYAKFLF